MADNVIKLAPSRNMLIQQAVLNAVAEHYLWGVSHYGAAEVLRRIQAAGLLSLLCVEVVYQFHKLTDTYDQAPAEQETEFEDIGPGFASC